MVVEVLKRLFNARLNWVPTLDMDGINYEEVLRLNSEDVSFDLNGKAPKLYIQGQEAGVVSMTTHYVTCHDRGAGFNVVTFVYLTEDDPEQKVLSINRITGEVMNQ